MKLSIITINYNNLVGLKKTTQSILSQSYNGYEWIVIDGGSDDGSREFLTKYNANIAYWCSEKDNGIYNAMNKGIVKAQGDYVLFLNSGDYLYDESVLSKVFCNDIDADILYGNAYFLYKKHPRVWIYDDTLTLKRLYEYSINHQSTFIRTVLLKECGYDESYKIAADWKRFVEWFQEGKIFKHIPIIVSVYDTTGISTKHCDMVLEERDRFFPELYSLAVIDVLKDWSSFQNKPCLLTRELCNASKVLTRIIRSILHFLAFIHSISK